MNDKERENVELIINSGLFDLIFFSKESSVKFTNAEDAILFFLKKGCDISFNPLVDINFCTANYGIKKHEVIKYLLQNRNASPHPLFDTDWYVDNNIDVKNSDLHPLFHYQNYGFRELRDPNPFFSVSYYLRKNEDVANAGIEPLHHYLKYGEKELRNPNPYFSLKYYFSKNPALRRMEIGPLHHFIYYSNRGIHRPNPFLLPSWYLRRTNKKFEELFLDLEEETDFKNFCPDIDVDYLAEYLNISGFDVTSNVLEELVVASETDPKILSFIEDGLIYPKTMDDIVRKNFPVTQSSLKRNIEFTVKKKPLFTVIMPTYNRRDIISDSIDSVLNQTYKNFELIVVDDSSGDATIEYLEDKYRLEIKTGLLRVLTTSSNLGASGARNLGLEISKGDYVAYLDSDNFWFEDTLKNYAYVYETYNPLTVYTPILYADENLDSKKVIGESYSRYHLLKSNFIDMNGFSHSRKLYEILGGFDDSLTRLVDWELIIRYTKDYVPIYFPVISTYYRVNIKGVNSITNSVPLVENHKKIQSRHAIENLSMKVINSDYYLKLIRDGYDVESLKPSRKRKILKFAIIIEDSLDTNEFLVKLSDLTTLYFSIFKFSPSNKEFTCLKTDLNFDISDLSDFDYFYYPSNNKDLLPEAIIKQVLLSASIESLDYCIVSNSLESSLEVKISSFRNNVVVSRQHFIQFAFRNCENVFRGRVLNINYNQKESFRNYHLDSLFNLPIKIDGYGFITNKEHSTDIFYKEKGLFFKPKVDRSKPYIVLVGMKISVGGVERLSLDIIETLSKNFNFIYLSLEKSSNKNGSLFQEISNVSTEIYCMSEISVHSQYERVLDFINHTYNPSLLLQMNGSTWWCDNYGLIRKCFENVPFIDHQCYDSEEGWINKLESGPLRNSEYFIAVNDDIERRMIADFGLPTERIARISHGVNFSTARSLSNLDKESVRKEFGIDNFTKVFAFVGRLTDQKDPLCFLELAKSKLISMPDTLFLLIGDGELAQLCDNYIDEHSLSNVKCFRNIRPISKLFYIIDGIVITSKYEGLPLALIEAIYCGVPVLSTNVGEIKPVVERYKAGMIIDRNTEFESRFDDFASLLPEFNDNIDDCREIFCDEFDITSVCKKFNSIFVELIDD